MASSCSFFILLHPSLSVLPYRYENGVPKIGGRDFLAAFSAKKSVCLSPPLLIWMTISLDFPLSKRNDVLLYSFGYACPMARQNTASMSHYPTVSAVARLFTKPVSGDGFIANHMEKFLTNAQQPRTNLLRQLTKISTHIRCSPGHRADETLFSV